MIRHFIISILFLIILAPFKAGAAAPDLALIDKIRTYYENNTSFTANFDQRLSHKESGAVEKRTGSISFQKPLRVRWQTAKPNEEILVINDKEIWDYLPEEEVAYKYSPDLVRESGGIIQVLTGQAALNRDFDVKMDGRENGAVKLLLYPHEPTTQLVEALIWVDPEEGAIRRARITDFYGNQNDVSLRNFKPGGVKSGDFKLSLPKNVDIEDRVNNESGKKLFQ